MAASPPAFEGVVKAGTISADYSIVLVRHDLPSFIGINNFFGKNKVFLSHFSIDSQK